MAKVGGDNLSHERFSPLLAEEPRARPRQVRARGDGVSPTTARDHKPHCLIHKTVLKSI